MLLNDHGLVLPQQLWKDTDIFILFYFTIREIYSDYLQCSVSYRLVLLPGHVTPEDGLHSQGGSLLLPVAFLLHIHSLVLLDDGGCLSASHELGKAERIQERLKGITLLFNYNKFEYINI